MNKNSTQNTAGHMTNYGWKVSALNMIFKRVALVSPTMGKIFKAITQDPEVSKVTCEVNFIRY